MRFGVRSVPFADDVARPCLDVAPVDSVAQAQLNLEAAGSEEKIEEAAADKGYHKLSTLELADELDIRTYIPEPKRRFRYRWIDKSLGQQKALYANRRRMRGQRGKRLQRQRSEKVERSFAHVCETGGARRACDRNIRRRSRAYRLASRHRAPGSAGRRE